MINRKNTNGSTKSAGKVEMTLEAYNDMLLELNAFRSAFTIVDDGNYIRFDVDIKPVMELYSTELAKYENSDKYEKNYWIKDTMRKTLYDKKEEEEVQE